MSFDEEHLDDHRECRREIERLQEFIRYWSYCTRTAMMEKCPELNHRWIEEMRELCPGGLVENAVSDLVHGVPAAEKAAQAKGGQQ